MKEKRLKSCDDVWVCTRCGGCYCRCAIRVHVVNGVAVKIEGEPDNDMGARGGLCGKGAATLQLLYDPNRLKVPLRRTNSEKGLFVDPKWKEITWEEALDEIEERLQKILNDDPRKLFIQGTTTAGMRGVFGFHIPLKRSLGVVDGWPGGGGLHCGNGAHIVAGLTHASWSIVPDYEYSNYVILFGASKGHAAGHSAMITARRAAEAKARGMKLVVFDPLCNFAGGKATEWVPVIPGTDGAIALAMCNVIVNELGASDAVYLKTKTNAPYLVCPDGRYVREKGPARGVKIPAPHGGTTVTAIGDDDTNKPLVWDASERKAKVYDDPTIGDYALGGEYEVRGINCRPAFQLIREHLKSYTPEMASKVSTVPAETIRRIATEFAQEAKVGSTIMIEGKDFPFRPVSAVLFRGGEGHENSHHTCYAVDLLNHIVGAADVPGGTLGWPAQSLGYPETGKLKMLLQKGVDGFLTTDHFNSFSPGPWPLVLPEFRGEASLLDIFSLAPFTYIYGGVDREQIWQQIRLPYRWEMMISLGCNVPLSLANREAIAEFLGNIPFIAVFELYSTELAEGFADILLPDTCYLETSNFLEACAWNFNYPQGREEWVFQPQQAVVDPQYSRRDAIEVVRELLVRLGKEAALNEFWNHTLRLDEASKLKPKEKVSWKGLSDRALKYWFGSECDMEWFKEHGFISWPKKVEEAYWRYFVDARVPIYLEYMVDIGDKVKELISQIGLEIDLSQYTPLISWTSCSPHRVDDPEYDLYCYSYRDIMHTGSWTSQLPWVDEASQMNPYTYNITMNEHIGRRRGLSDGDIVEIETYQGRKAQGAVKLVAGQHPQTVGIAACLGHWAKGMPIAKGKGTNFDDLLPIDLKHVDPVSLNLETCVRVKVSKLERK